MSEWIIGAAIGFETVRRAFWLIFATASCLAGIVGCVMGVYRIWEEWD